MQREVKQKAYLSPKVTVCAFAPEQGFALSTVTEDYGFSGTGIGAEGYGLSGTGSCMESYGETEPAAAAEGYGSFSF